MSEPGWQELLERYHYRETDLILVPRFLPLAQEIEQLKRWKPVYRDLSLTVYARRNSMLPQVEQKSAVWNGKFP